MTESLTDRILELKNRCLRCWADAVSDIFPQSVNRKRAADEMEKYGNPLCKCIGETIGTNREG